MVPASGVEDVTEVLGEQSEFRLLDRLPLQRRILPVDQGPLLVTDLLHPWRAPFNDVVCFVPRQGRVLDTPTPVTPGPQGPQRPPAPCRTFVFGQPGF